MTVTKTSLAYFLENSRGLIHFLNEGMNQCSSEQTVYVSKGGGPRNSCKSCPFIVLYNGHASNSNLGKLNPDNCHRDQNLHLASFACLTESGQLLKSQNIIIIK